jgi:hypothetical protein
MHRGTAPLRGLGLKRFRFFNAGKQALCADTQIHGRFRILCFLGLLHAPLKVRHFGAGER